MEEGAEREIRWGGKGIRIPASYMILIVLLIAIAIFIILYIMGWIRPTSILVVGSTIIGWITVIILAMLGCVFLGMYFSHRILSRSSLTPVEETTLESARDVKRALALLEELRAEVERIEARLQLSEKGEKGKKGSKIR